MRRAIHNRRRFGPLVSGPALLVGYLFFAGCVDEEAGSDSFDEPRISSRGIIALSHNRYIEAGSEESFEQFDLTGIFARFPEAERAAVDTLWGGPVAEVDLPLDGCTGANPVLENRARVRTPAAESSVELLDIGDLSISFDGKQRTIPTRTFPDLLKAVMGVIYAADETQGVVFRPGQTYTLQATGVDDKRLFHVSLKAPDDLGQVTLNSTTPGDDIPILANGLPILLSWNGGGFGDEVIISIRWTQMGAPFEITCRARDDGSFTIPSDITAQFPDPLNIADEEVSVHRIRQVAFRAKEPTSGLFRFIVSIHFPVKF